MGQFLLSNSPSSEPDVWFVCVLGIGVVFAGLLCLVVIVALSNAILSKKTNKPISVEAKVSTVNEETTTAPIENKQEMIENKQEIIAAVCAAIAEENGVSISAIRVLSFKKI